jgi:hypothetical protein
VVGAQCEKASKEKSILIYVGTSRVIRMSRNEGRNITIKIGGEILEQVKQFCYLGSTVTEDYKSNSKIRKL